MEVVFTHDVAGARSRKERRVSYNLTSAVTRAGATVLSRSLGGSSFSAPRPLLYATDCREPLGRAARGEGEYDVISRPVLVS
jgi:hypothetical protein